MRGGAVSEAEPPPLASRLQGAGKFPHRQTRTDVPHLLEPIATFSLVAHDPGTGDLGVAVASKFLAVGAYVPYAQAGVGAVATQAFVNPTFGPRALRILAEGGSPDEAREAFVSADGGIAQRQFGIVAAGGDSVSFTGSECHAWAGGRSARHYAAQGNILEGPQVVDALVETHLTRDDVPFPERLLEALAAADAEGGDQRGRQSAALLVVGESKGYAGFDDRWVDLRVDDHTAPIPELRRLLALHRLYLTKPEQPPRELDADDVHWLQERLRERGLLDGSPNGRWDAATERALEGLFGIENLEERWLGGPRVDPVAWRHLRTKLGGGGA